MDVTRAAAVHRTITTAGLAGASEPELLRLFCETIVRKGLPLGRANLLIDTLHPVHEGRAFRWRRDEPQPAPILEYGRTNVAGSHQDNWRRSPFYHLLQTGESLLRCRLASDSRSDSPSLTSCVRRGRRITWYSSTALPPKERSAKWMAYIRAGRPTIRTASRTSRFRPSR